MRFSQKTGCFYPEDIFYAELPDDLIDVSQSEFAHPMGRGPDDRLQVVDGRIVVVPGAPPDSAKILSRTRSEVLSRIEAYAKTKRAQLAETADEIEIAAWGNKLRIAQAIQEQRASAADVLAFETEIAARGLGETMEKFCAKVFRRAGMFARAVGLIDGMKKNMQLLVGQAQTPDELLQLAERFQHDFDIGLQEMNFSSS